MAESKLDLAAEGLLDNNTTQAADPNQETPNENDLVEFINQTLLALQDSMGSLQIGLRIMNQRITTIERFTSYLLEQDPVAGAKMKEHMKKVDEEEAKRAAEGTPTDAAKG